jgi:membrane protease subunit (stomatin/prohibitin family)
MFMPCPSSRREVSVAALLVVAYVCLSTAQAQTSSDQRVTGPQARYWIQAETGTGFLASAMQGGGGLGSMMGAVMGSLTGRSGGPTKSLRLELGGLREGNPSEAQHAVPAGLGVGASLTLAGA